MKINLYDFDGTIYDGDSSKDFFFFCLKRNLKIFKKIIKILFYAFKYLFKKTDITEFKEVVFSFLNDLNDVDKMVSDFWAKNEKKIKSFYKNKNHSNDVIISASPEFLLGPIAEKLHVLNLIASDVDKYTGKFRRPNCRGKEKIVQFVKNYPESEIISMYSDSMHDKPLLDIAHKSYLVKKNKIIDYHTYRPNIIKSFWNWGWGIYHKKEEVWNYLIVGGLTTIVSISSYAFFTKTLYIYYISSNILSWIVAVIFAYFTNRWFVFHSKKSKRKEAISFIGSRVATMLLDTGLMFLLVSCILLNDMIAKIIVQIIIVFVNYSISKMLVFKK